MRFGFFFLLLVCLFSCSSDPVQELQPLNLLKYGIPLVLLAPDSAKVKSVDMGIAKDITVVGNDDYSIQIIASKALTNDLAKIKADQISGVKSNPFFSKIVKEEAQGFIFENAIDSARTNYGFRYIHLIGDQELVIQNGLLGIFSLEEIETMYQAVHAQKMK